MPGHLAESWLSVFGNDLYSFAASAMLLVVYHPYLRRKVRKDPTYTVQAVNIILIAVLYKLDRAPKALAQDYRA